MLKYENVAEVGQTIRALDFQSRSDCFIEGIVLRKGKQYMEQDGRQIYIGDGYTIKVTKSSSGPEDDFKSSSNSESFNEMRMGTEMIVPFEISFDFDNRVELI